MVWFGGSLEQVFDFVSFWIQSEQGFGDKSFDTRVCLGIGHN